eukprot:SAG11_NODE_153_length_14352_cov_24.348323_10_plen_86_part_00
MEDEAGRFDILQCNARPNGPSNANIGIRGAIHSNALLQLTFDDGREQLERVLCRVQALLHTMPQAEADASEIRDFCRGDFGRTLR